MVWVADGFRVGLASTVGDAVWVRVALTVGFVVGDLVAAMVAVATGVRDGAGDGVRDFVTVAVARGDGVRVVVGRAVSVALMATATAVVGAAV